MEDLIRVPDVFKNRNIFITGGSGFIGKVLIEKLLRSCPNIGNLYLLIRPKRGKTIQERIEIISKLPLFEKLNSTNPNLFNSKVIPINGDVCLPNLGISQEDKQTLINNVHMVFHVAATVKFDQSLQEAIFMNVRGTREVCNLTLELPKCILMVQISTAYAHTQFNPIEEKMYPATTSWRDCINAAEKLDQYDLSKLQALIMGPFPNTYTFTKGLAERVVYDLLDGKIDNMIIRPSIVICTWRDPIPGWIDNFNGPVGMIAANGTGLIRINLLKEAIADFVPVDMAVRAIMNIAWYRLTQKNEYESKSTTVHNCSSNKFSKLSTYDVAEIAHSLAEEAALSTCVWYPTLRRTENITIFRFVFILLHILPALFFDSVLKLLNYKPIVLNIQRRIFVAINALQYFILNQWTIKNDSLLNLEKKLCKEDFKSFGYEGDTMNYVDFFRNGMYGGMKYLLNEDMSKLKQNRQRVTLLKYVDKIFTILFFSCLVYVLFMKWNVHQIVYNYVDNYLTGLHTPLSFLPPAYQ